MEWALRAGCPATWDRRYGGAASLAEVAAQLGYSALVQWLFRKKHCPVNTEVMRGAVIAGNFQLAKWCKARGKVPEWGAASDGGASWAPGSKEWTVCSEAATHGHLEILRWAHKKGCPLGDSARAAARTGKVDCLEVSEPHWIVVPVSGGRAERLTGWCSTRASTAVRWTTRSSGPRPGPTAVAGTWRR